MRFLVEYEFSEDQIKYILWSSGVDDKDIEISELYMDSAKATAHRLLVRRYCRTSISAGLEVAGAAYLGAHPELTDEEVAAMEKEAREAREKEAREASNNL